MILMRSLDIATICRPTNTRTATKLLNEYPFGKYIIEGISRLLWKGTAYKFEILDFTKLEVNLLDCFSSRILQVVQIPCHIRSYKNVDGN